MKNIIRGVAFTAALILNILTSQAATQNPVTSGCPISQWVNAVNSNIPGQACAQITISDLAGAGNAGQILVSNGPNAAPSFASSASVLIPGITVPVVPNAVNGIVLTSTVTGGIATISSGGVGSDANAALGLSSQGNGNIVLFSGNSNSTGILQFANATSFVKATGLGACPGVAPLNPPLGVSTAVSGYLVWADILGTKHSAVSC